jgi:hypothetical protein
MHDAAPAAVECAGNDLELARSQGRQLSGS